MSTQTMLRILWLTIMMLGPLNTARADVITLYAAGSLKTALSEILNDYRHLHDIQINSQFGPSGLLREAIETGETVDIFVSANMAHPQTLATQGWGETVTLLTRNQLCALAQPDIKLTNNNFLETLLDKNIRLGTSTPKYDPSGDYAWEMFNKAEQIYPGSFKILSKKARQLTGGPNSPKAPETRNQYAWVMQQYQVDVFLTYCTNTVLAKQELPELQIIQLPDNLAVGAEYGLVIRQGAPDATKKLAMYMLSPEGQSTLHRHGFTAD
ncbi:MAG: molybdate ABC transporter substrate-binding protein [Methylophaga sp.]|uniref:molybdate ABC transporter substrate-binding protein n=1 Tax=Methylophaga sp. TaxID=2024840 RepID=UPI00216DECF3|nr:molybdate ABC transporter substrate-binding protein [Methylophaga sp.]MBL1456693.1 molybdate ABC transporter substrate-binding protein [Methylophaga sp.]MBL1458518.1 molybdate ABC transporter substrate-binding protein [Methylophaga sp.]